MVKLKDIVGILNTSFRVNKVPEPLPSAYFVLEKALNKSQKFLRSHPNASISLNYYNKIQKYAQRRLKHEPIQYILGEWDFRDLNLKMQRPTLIPRPETEQLVDIALELFKKHEGPFHFVDVGCGSGAISLSLLKEIPKSKGVAVDISYPALKLTLNNFYRVFGKETNLDDRLDLIQSSFKAFADKNVHKFDLIISNPPYIPTNEVNKLEKQILVYEDKKALDGGEYGLDVIWELIRNASTELKSGGFLLIETSLGHPEYLEQYFRDHNDIVHNMTLYGTREDFSFRKRFVILQKKPKQGQEGKSSDESD